MSAKIKGVQGNVLRVAVPLTQKVTSLVEGQVVTVEQDFYPVGEVKVNLLAGWNTLPMQNTVDGNVVTFVDVGMIPPNCYALEILCTDDQGSPCRFYMDCAVQIVRATKDAGIEPGVEFDGETQTLDGALFIFAKGDKGDTGVGIASIAYKETLPNGDNVYTITMTDRDSYDFESPKGDKGDDGDSAYEVAVRNGYIGTEEEWLESLKGQDADMSQLYTKDESDARYQQKEPGMGLSSNDYTTAEKQKLAGLENYDDSSIRWLIQNVQASLANYYTKSETYSRSQVDALIAGIQGMEIVSVNVLPSASASTMGKIYLVPSSSPVTRNIKDEYITVLDNSVYKWELIGSTDVDLTDYLKTTDVATVAISGSYNDLTDKPTIPDTSTFVQKSQTAGLLKNDGTVDTSTYLTQHQDISGKADKVSSATNGNFAGLDSNGNLTDSGKKASDFQAALSTQTAYTSKGSATKVPQITTNTLGQVTGITEVTITQPDVSNLISKSNTAGLVKNDGTIDTTSYGTYSKPSGGIPASDIESGVIPDVSGKEDKMAIEATPKTASFTAVVDKYYFVNIAASGSVTITLTTPSDSTTVSSAVFRVTTSTSPALTFAAATGVDIYVGSSYSIEASKVYEINALWNGVDWSIICSEIQAQS